MQITQILISLVLISIVQAAWVTRILKPRLNSLIPSKLEIPENPKHKLPDERPKFSLFPKSNMKYVISPEAIYKIATHKPIMKKLSQLEKNNKVVEYDAEQLTVNAEPVYDSISAVTPKMNPAVISKEASLEVVEENLVHSSEIHNDSIEKKDKQQIDSNEIKIGKADAEKNEFPSLQDLIIPPTAKPFEVTKEYKTEDVSYKTKNSKENESSDSVEFIFADPTHKPKKTKKAISEEPKVYVTTEFYEEPKIARRKRGSNIIEEENLASTVAGYKYTWKDTRLNNDVAFKNIHS